MAVDVADVVALLVTVVDPVDDTVDVPLVDTEVVADEVADVVTVDETLDV